jgi:hypothetical protein
VNAGSKPIKTLVRAALSVRARRSPRANRVRAAAVRSESREQRSLSPARSQSSFAGNPWAIGTKFAES